MTERWDSQRGSALMFVMIVGTVVSLGFGYFITSTVLSEKRAVEAELAKARVYWAEMGNYNYALSRVSYSRLCNSCGSKNNKDTDLATVFQAYFNELGNLQTWTYPDESTNYSIKVSETAAADNTPGRQTFSGYLMATSAYTASPLVAGSSGKLPILELRLCVGLQNSGSHCGNITNNNGGNATTFYSINRFTNLPLP